MDVEMKIKKKEVLGFCPFTRKDCTRACEWWLKNSECCAICQIADSLEWLARQTSRAYCAIFNALNKARKLLSLLEEKGKEIEKLNNWHETLQQEIAKVATYLKLPGDGRPFSEQVMEWARERENVISLLQTSLGEMRQYLHNAKLRIHDLEQGIGEVLDGTLPYLAEKRLKKLIE